MYNSKVYWHKVHVNLPQYTGQWSNGEWITTGTTQDILATITHHPEGGPGVWVYKEVDLLTGDIVLFTVHSSYNSAMQDRM